jgi:hypothetical protein
MKSIRRRASRRWGRYKFCRQAMRFSFAHTFKFMAHARKFLCTAAYKLCAPIQLLFLESIDWIYTGTNNGRHALADIRNSGQQNFGVFNRPVAGKKIFRFYGRNEFPP